MVYFILHKNVWLKNGGHFKMDPPYYFFGALDFFSGAFPQFQMGPPYYYFGALDLFFRALDFIFGALDLFSGALYFFL